MASEHPERHYIGKINLGWIVEEVEAAAKEMMWRYLSNQALSATHAPVRKQVADNWFRWVRCFGSDNGPLQQKPNYFVQNSSCFRLGTVGVHVK